MSRAHFVGIVITLITAASSALAAPHYNQGDYGVGSGETLPKSRGPWAPTTTATARGSPGCLLGSGHGLPYRRLDNAMPSAMKGNACGTKTHEH